MIEIPGWNQALASLGIQQHWKNTKLKIEVLKKMFTTGSLSMTIPVLILGIKRIDYEPTTTKDVQCTFQDASGNN